MTERQFPEKIGHGQTRLAIEPPDAAVPAAFDHEARPIGADGDGYLQIIDADELLALATREDVLLRLERRPGNYVVCGSPLVMVWPGDEVPDEFAARVQSAFSLGNQRTAAQDVEFPVHQLVEIAVRALSPGINDPFTAVACVDRLGSALCRLAERNMPPSHRFDGQGVLRGCSSRP